MNAIIRRWAEAATRLIRSIGKKQASPKSLLVGDIREVSGDLESAYNRFENATDDDLIEASIFEIEALRARYRYLIKAVKNAD